MNIKKFGRKMKPEEILKPEELEAFKKEFYLSKSWSKKQILDQAQAWFLQNACKWQLIQSLNAKIETLEKELGELKTANTPPVENPPVCQHCGKILKQQTGGRKKKYCSEACKQKTKRERTH